MKLHSYGLFRFLSFCYSFWFEWCYTYHHGSYEKLLKVGVMKTTSLLMTLEQNMIFFYNLIKTFNSKDNENYLSSLRKLLGIPSDRNLNFGLHLKYFRKKIISHYTFN